MLSIAVLTSDDARFSAGAVEEARGADGGFSDEGLNAAAQTVIDVCARPGETPALALAYPSARIGSGRLSAPLRRHFAGLPVFGGFSCDQTVDYADSAVIYNGTAYPFGIALVLIYGDVTADFFIASAPFKAIQKQYAIITESDSFVVKKINGMPFSDYLERMGFHRETFESIPMLPFSVDFTDKNFSHALGRALHHVYADGSGEFAAEMPEGAFFAISALDADGILETARTLSQKAADSAAADSAIGRSCALMYSCFARNIMLGTNYLDELRIIADIMEGSMPYLCAYAGGELCPTESGGGEMVNSIHNFTFIICVLR
jgi:hypothetical protein